jgi:type IV secretory pathway TrbD component
MLKLAAPVFTTNSHTGLMIADYFFGARLMTWVIIFVGVWAIALALLLRFAARIDPRSGRWRRR